VLLGALLSARVAAAQAIPPVGAPPIPGDTVGLKSPADTVPDSLKVKKDSIEAPFAHAPLPPLLEIGESYTWDRAALFNTGMITITSVLEHVPGLTIYRSGWFPSPQYAAYLGNPARLRIFWDGAEMLPIGNSTSYPVDLASVPIWAVQQMTLERGADEVRIYLRSWDVTRTTTQSRVDIVTGDLGTNMLRGYFGTRFQNGMGVQFGGQVYGTLGNLTLGGGTGSDFMLRVGWARGGWSVDAFAERSNAERDPQIATTYFDYAIPANTLSPGIPGESGSRTHAYLRAGLGQPDSGTFWAQVMLDAQQVSQQLKPSLSIDYAPLDSLLVTQHATQLIAMAGATLGAARVSVSDRLGWLPTGTDNELSARASLASRVLALSAYADYVTDSGRLLEGTLKVTPVPFLAFELTAGYRTALDSLGGSGLSGRLAVGGRIGRVWVQAGLLRRAASVVPGLTAYDTAYVTKPTAQATGPFFSIQGKVVEDLGINIWVIRWDSAGTSASGYYRPQLQSRAEVFLDTKWLSRFPSGHFEVHGAFGEEYRSDVIFPTTVGTEAFGPNAVVAVHSNVLYANLQIRVLTATLYATATWALSPRPYELVPRYIQPPQVYTYGMRWEFWN
jgi:hypothetical protein